MENKTNLERLPSRIKYYLLEWKDKHMNDYLSRYGEVRLNDLSFNQLRDFFNYATTKDQDIMKKF